MKKVLALALAGAMTLGMGATAFAETAVDSLGSSADGTATITTTWLAEVANGAPMGLYDGSLSLIDAGGTGRDGYVGPGDKFDVAAFGLDVTGYNYSGSAVRSKGNITVVNATYDANDPATYSTTADFSRNKVTLKRRVSKGSALIEEPALKSRTVTVTDPATNVKSTLRYVAVQVEFKDPIVSVKDQEFDFTLYLAKSGTKMSGTELTITGYHENERINVDEDDEVNLSDGQYAYADEYTKGISVDTGNGLYIKTNMFKDQKYYAKSEQDVSSADDEIIAKYPEIDTIYTLYTINMSSASNVVTFDIDDKYYVYNQDGKYIGMTNEKLPMANKYYLATKKIDMDADDITEAPDTDAPVGNGSLDVDMDSPTTGGDDVDVNVNDNPGTGANSFVNVAVVAGMVALAAGAVSMKK